MIWTYIGQAADVFGIFGFFASLAAFITAKSIKEQIDSSIELHDFSNNKAEYVSKIEACIKSLTEDSCNTKSILYEISSLNKSIDTRYSCLSGKLASAILELQNFIEEIFRNFSGSINPSQQFELVNKLSVLKELLRKEDRNHE